jgi:hypothetical protein
MGLFSHPVLAFGSNALLKVSLRTTELISACNLIQRFSNEKFASLMVSVIMAFGGGGVSRMFLYFLSYIGFLCGNCL